MQDVQNIPNPDVNSTENDGDFNPHSENEDVERPDESIPTPPDRAPAAPVEEPPDTERAPVGEDEDEPQRIM